MAGVRDGSGSARAGRRDGNGGSGGGCRRQRQCSADGCSSGDCQQQPLRQPAASCSHLGGCSHCRSHPTSNRTSRHCTLPACGRPARRARAHIVGNGSTAISDDEAVQLGRRCAPGKHAVHEGSAAPAPSCTAALQAAAATRSAASSEGGAAVLHACLLLSPPAPRSTRRRSSPPVDGLARLGIIVGMGGAKGGVRAGSVVAADSCWEKNPNLRTSDLGNVTRGGGRAASCACAGHHTVRRAPQGPAHLSTRAIPHPARARLL